MKVKALANLSGKTGDRSKGDEFTVGAAHGRELIERGLVAEVEAPAPQKTSAAKKPAAKPKAAPAVQTTTAAE